MGRRRIGIEQHHGAREITVRDPAYRHPTRSVLLCHDRAWRKSRKVNDEPRRRALARFRGGPFPLAVVLIITIVTVPFGVAAVPVPLRVTTIPIPAVSVAAAALVPVLLRIPVVAL